MAMNDQTAKADAGKPQLTLVPRQIIYDICEVREYGNKKYHDPDNWKTVEIERYRDALFRHFMAYLDDPDGVDEESGIPHYKHMACNMAFICEMEKRRSDNKSAVPLPEIAPCATCAYRIMGCAVGSPCDGCTSFNCYKNYKKGDIIA